MNGTFSFGNVSGPVNAGSGNMNVGCGIQNVAGGDLHIGHRVGDDPTAAADLDALRALLPGLGLTDADRAAAEDELDALTDTDDRAEASSRLEAFVSTVRRAGAIADAGSSLAGAVTRLAAWIGPLAAGAVTLLGR